MKSDGAVDFFAIIRFRQQISSQLRAIKNLKNPPENSKKKKKKKNKTVINCIVNHNNLNGVGMWIYGQ